MPRTLLSTKVERPKSAKRDVEVASNSNGVTGIVRKPHKGRKVAINSVSSDQSSGDGDGVMANGRNTRSNSQIAGIKRQSLEYYERHRLVSSKPSSNVVLTKSKPKPKATKNYRSVKKTQSLKGYLGSQEQQMNQDNQSPISASPQRSDSNPHQNDDAKCNPSKAIEPTVGKSKLSINRRLVADPIKQNLKSRVGSTHLRKTEALQFLTSTGAPRQFRFREREIEEIVTSIRGMLGIELACGKRGELAATDKVLSQTKGTKSNDQDAYQGQLNRPRVLMITGSPGSGKSLTINSILAGAKVNCIKLNSNLIKTIKELQAQICLQLLGVRNGHEMTILQIIGLLEQRMTSGESNNGSRERKDAKIPKEQKTNNAPKGRNIPPTIIYIEETELFFKQETRDFFTLFTHRGLKIMLLGISNTIDTLQRYGERIGIDVRAIKNIVFKPYTVEQASIIMREKLNLIYMETGMLVSFPDKLMMYACTKMDSFKKGDLRFLFDFLKECVLLAFGGYSKSTGHKKSVEDLANNRGNENKQTASLGKQVQNSDQEYAVTIDIVSQVFSKMSSKMDDLILSLPFQYQIILIALFHYIKRTEALAVPLKDLTKDLRWVCDCMKLTFSPQLLDDGIPQLQQYCMVNVTRKNNETRVLMKVALSDIQASFSDHPVFKKFFTDT